MTKWLHLLYLFLDVVLTNFKSLPLLLQFNLLFYYILQLLKAGQLETQCPQVDPSEFSGLVRAVLTSLFLASPGHYLLHY
jgi:ABC-type amino acid transport system permease subunit